MDNHTGWEETQAILHEMEELYKQGSAVDTERIRECLNIRQQILSTYNEGTESTVDLIRNFTKEVELLKEAAAELAGKDSSTPEIEDLKLRIKSSEQRSQNYLEEQSSLHKEVEALENKMKEITSEGFGISQNVSAPAPVMQHLLGLYANITKIKWDYSTDKVAGVVSDLDGQVRKFNLDSTQKSSFDIANSIWDVISTN